MSDDLNNKFNLIQMPDQVTALSTEIASDNAKKDFAQARSAMADIVDVAARGVNDLSNLAFQGQDANSYLALSSMIKAGTDAAQALLKLHKQLQELDNPNNNKEASAPGSLHNHIHLASMSTNDLKEALKALKSND